MTTVLEEGDLRINVDDAVSARKFDDEETHMLSHCMKAVDFIVELSESYVFIEVKDPDDPNSSERERRRFLERFQRGGLDEDLKYKYRDSFLYEWAHGRVDKPIYYFVLVAHGELDGYLLNRRTDELQRILPLTVPGGLDWRRPIVQDAGVFDLDSWNRTFPQFPVERISAGAGC